MNNILIVESDNDKYFIESLVCHLNLTITIDNPICSVNDYECLGGLGALQEKLISVSKKIRKDGIDKIGIILDADKEGIEKRIGFINEKIKNICSDIELDKTNNFKYSSELQVYIGCYITNKDGFGELETVLKEIASQDSTYADCLEAWRDCLKEKGKPEISQKDFDKFWISNYLRFDTCLPSEKSQAGRKCNYEAGIKKDIWDFGNTILDELKDFLKLLNK